MFFVFFLHSYHTGSLAFGSLLLAMVQMIRIVLENLHLKLKRKFELFNKPAFLLWIKWTVISNKVMLASQVLKVVWVGSCFTASSAASGVWKDSSSFLTQMHTLW